MNCRGWGDWSNPSLPYIVPEPPPQPNGQARDYSNSDALGTVEDGRPLSSSEHPHKATWHWDEPCGHGAQINGYNVQYSLNPSDEDSIISTTLMNRATHIDISDLLPNRVYYLRTQAINSVGTSDWTGWSAGVATAATGPEQQDPPISKDAKTNEILIGWVPPFACGFRIIKYTVRICDDQTMRNALVLEVKRGQDKTDNDCTLRVVDLTPNSTYFFQVRAESEIGVSEWSEGSLPIKTKASKPADIFQFVEFFTKIW